MGAGAVSKEAAARNREITNELNREKRSKRRLVNLLLLGSGNSGKSTLAKQMKVLRLDGFTEQEQKFYQEHIYLNLVRNVNELLDLLNSQTIELEQDENMTENVTQVQDWLTKRQTNSNQYCESLATAIDDILQNSVVANALKEPAVFLKLPDSAGYFFEHRHRIGSKHYIPTEDDIFRCRIPTTGIQELHFTVKKLRFCLIDVGGQKGQRRKWIGHFQDVKGLVFVTAMSEYDKQLEEDPSINRMHDSLQLFKKVSRNKYFARTAILIFLNKKDLFQQKIGSVPLSVCFSDCPEDQDFETASEYLKEQFLKVKPSKKSVFTHFTNATNTQNVYHVFELTFDIILDANMKVAGLAVPE